MNAIERICGQRNPLGTVRYVFFDRRDFDTSALNAQRLAGRTLLDSQIKSISTSDGRLSSRGVEVLQSKFSGLIDREKISFLIAQPLGDVIQDVGHFLQASLSSTDYQEQVIEITRGNQPYASVDRETAWNNILDDYAKSPLFLRGKDMRSQIHYHMRNKGVVNLLSSICGLTVAAAVFNPIYTNIRQLGIYLFSIGTAGLGISMLAKILLLDLVVSFTKRHSDLGLSYKGLPNFIGRTVAGITPDALIPAEFTRSHYEQLAIQQPSKPQNPLHENSLITEGQGIQTEERETPNPPPRVAE